MSGIGANSASFVQKKRHSCKNGCESWQKVLYYEPARGTQWKGRRRAPITMMLPINKEENYNEKMALSDKHLKLYLTAIKWIQLKQKGKSIGSYLYKKGYRTVAIYGMSYMGESLATELAGSQIEVRYGIDRNAQGLHSAVKVYQPEDALEQVDIILNTTNIENWKILENMKEQGIPMLRFDEILGDME